MHLYCEYCNASYITHKILNLLTYFSPFLACIFLQSTEKVILEFLFSRLILKALLNGTSLFQFNSKLFLAPNNSKMQSLTTVGAMCPNL